MSKQKSLQKAMQLIENSPALNSKGRQFWIEKARRMNEQQLQQLCTIFTEEKQRNTDIEKNHRSVLQKRKREYKNFLDDFQHSSLPRLLSEVESKTHEAEMAEAEKSINTL